MDASPKEQDQSPPEVLAGCRGAWRGFDYSNESKQFAFIVHSTVQVVGTWYPYGILLFYRCFRSLIQVLSLGAGVPMSQIPVT